MFSVDPGAAPLFLGFALGMRPALDADHVVAMSTIVTRERSIARAALLGGVWGAGHSLSLLAVGLIVIVFRIPLNPTVEIVFERLVGAMLVVLGLTSLLLRHRHPSKGEPTGRSARRRPFGVGGVHVLGLDRCEGVKCCFRFPLSDAMGLTLAKVGDTIHKLLVISFTNSLRTAVLRRHDHGRHVRVRERTAF